MIKKYVFGVSAVAMALAFTGPAVADDNEFEVFGRKFNMSGSLRDGGFDRYVPSVLNPLFNETPFITSEVRALYAYHDVPDDFVTGGGTIQVAAAQIRVAFSERLGLIATQDGYTDVDFEGTLTDDDGPNDIAAGLKYAFHYDPEDGEIITGGIRYTAPAGNISTFLGPREIELNGVGAGFINVFGTGAKIWNDFQAQGSVGVQYALNNSNSSFFHGSTSLSYELLPGFYPMIESSVFVPVNGGDRVTTPGLTQLTGAEFLDVGADDPQLITTVGGGFRLRPFNSDHVILGAAAEVNVTNREDTAYGYRVVTDLVLHF